MGIKIGIVKYKIGQKICVTYDALQYRRKTKTFKLDQRLEALDFANSLADRYITGIYVDIHDFAKIQNHMILKKSFCFA